MPKRVPDRQVDAMTSPTPRAGDPPQAQPPSSGVPRLPLPRLWRYTTARCAARAKVRGKSDPSAGVAAIGGESGHFPSPPPWCRFSSDLASSVFLCYRGSFFSPGRVHISKGVGPGTGRHTTHTRRVATNNSGWGSAIGTNFYGRKVKVLCWCLACASHKANRSDNPISALS